MDAIDKLRMKEFGGKPEIVARHMMSMIVPALVVGAVVDGLPEDDNWAKWIASSIGGEYAATVPLLRDIYSLVFKGYKDAGIPPAMKAAIQLGQPALDAKKAAQGDEVKHPIKDVGNAAGLFLPGLSQMGATSQFLYDVHTGAQTPETVGDWFRGIMSGSMKKH